jgi:hypothetical protein
MRGAACLAMVVLARAGSADDALGTRRRLSERAGPVLELDPALASAIAGRFRERELGAVGLDLGSRARAVVSADAWQAATSPDLLSLHDATARARGWRLALELRYDLGPIRIAASLAQEHAEAAREHADVRTLKLSITHTFDLAPTMHAWVGLELSHQQSVGPPPPGTPSRGTSLDLVLGTTFR